MQGFSAGLPGSITFVFFSISIGERQRSFVAGFLEAEASFRIHEQNGGQSLACQMTLNQRDDEQDTLEWLVASTGLGRLRRVAARLTSKPQIRWIVDSQDDCRELLELIGPCGFHGRRAAELALWRRAVEAWSEMGGEPRRSRMRCLRAELAAVRAFAAGAATAAPFAGETQRLGYISGFLCGEGCFGLSGGRPRFSVHLRGDDSPLLELLAQDTGLGKVTYYRPRPPLNPSSTWTVAARAEMALLRDLLLRGGLPGRKSREMEVWATAVEELNRAADSGVRPRRSVLAAAREQLRDLRVYQPSERELLQLPRRDLRTKALEALTAWSRTTDDRLSATKYTRWRVTHADAPDRNTIVRQFGSWQRALAAAGLADRSAASPKTVEARRRGGAEGRARRRAEQEDRVIAAVRRFERERGHLPRAMEFFRWRYDGAVDAPTQGTVYRLFPGGWAEVLERVRQAAGAERVRQAAGATV